MSSRKQLCSSDIPPLEIDQQSYLNFMSQFEPFLKAVMNILSHYLDRTFDEDEEYVPAALIFNPLVADNAFWINAGNEYGKSRTKDALGSLKRFEKWLQKADFKELPYPKQKKVIEGIPVYAGPLYFFVSEAVRSMETAQMLAATKFIIEHLERCIETEAGHRGNYRAFRTAVVLRAIFEIYSDLPVTSGDYYGVPSGPFCQCLEEIFEIGRIDSGFRHYAKKAQQVSADNPLLLDMKRELLEVPARVAAHQNSQSFTD